METRTASCLNQLFTLYFGIFGTQDSEAINSTKTKYRFSRAEIAEDNAIFNPTNIIKARDFMLALIFLAQ